MAFPLGQAPNQQEVVARAHVNMALIVKFMRNYFFAPAPYPELGCQSEPRNDDFLFAQGPTKGLGKIRFHDFAPAYASVDLPNVAVFRRQIEAFKVFLMASAADATASAAQAKDIDFLLSLGELFTLVAYGQLILEYRGLHPEELSLDLVEQIFDFMVRDFSTYALQLYHKPSSTPKQMELALALIAKPVGDAERFERVWRDELWPLRDAYEMSP
ncbi:MAG: hypothetical protein RBU37_21905 [Myxococcota bacterium]|nr:hypothetical protein [Myxococcota bacterium]